LTYRVTMLMRTTARIPPLSLAQISVIPSAVLYRTAPIYVASGRRNDLRAQAIKRTPE
jgi:hypothetical protein